MDWDHLYPRLAQHRQGHEGWLDTAARIEAERPLTPQEEREADRATDDFIKALQSMSAANSQEKTESGSTAPRRRRKAGGPSR